MDAKRRLGLTNVGEELAQLDEEIKALDAKRRQILENGSWNSHCNCSQVQKVPKCPIITKPTTITPTTAPTIQANQPVTTPPTPSKSTILNQNQTIQPTSMQNVNVNATTVLPLVNSSLPSNSTPNTIPVSNNTQAVPSPTG